MYGKIFEFIFDSSIADDYQLRHFFMDLIVLADSDGVVNKTPAAISARTRIPIQSVTEFLERLSQPDPESQTPDADGRRIELLDEHRTWGWHIINYQKYREIASEDQRKKKTRERVARFKLKRKELETGNASLTHGNASLTLANDSPYPSSYSYPLPKGGCKGETLPDLQRLVSGLMRRPVNDQWSYMELSSLAEIAKRPDCISEFRELEAFYKTMTERKYFPQSVLALVEKWGPTLDRARQPKELTPEQKKSIDYLIPKLPRNYDDAH